MMSGVEELQFVKGVNDPVHGYIRMTQEEHDVMDSRVYQRLRGIKQNGLLYFVFPSATHTRFEHSLGVMHMADRVLGALLDNSQAERAKSGDRALPASGKADIGHAVNFALIDRETRKQIFRVARLAALIHDMGHGPLSHTFDKFAPPVRQLRRFVPEGHPLASLRATLLPPETPQKAVKHEALSCLLFAWHWREERRHRDPQKGDDWVPLAVASAVLGRKLVEEIPADIPENLRPWIPLIQDIISSAPVDADRLDYVERDSLSCGVNYGLYDRDRLLKSPLCYRHDGNSYRLGWKISGLRAIEVFVHARFQLYAQIYYHKTSQATEEMMADITELMQKYGAQLFDKANSFDDLVQEYCDMSDDYFLRLLCGHDRDRLQDCFEVHALAKRVVGRHLYKRLYEETPKANISTVHAALNRLEGSEKLDLKPSTATLEATKDLSKGAVLLRRDESGRYAAPKRDSNGGAEDWLAASPLLFTLHQEEKKISRLYWKGNDQKEYERLQEHVRHIFNQRQPPSTNER